MCSKTPPSAPAPRSAHPLARSSPLALLLGPALILALHAQAQAQQQGQQLLTPLLTLTLAEPAKIDTGDTAWMLISTALVLMMTIPGLALFYGGLVRAKNVLSTLMHSLFCCALIGVVWVVVGYSAAFGPTVGGWFGSPGHHWLLDDIAGTNSPLAPTIPHYLFVIYQLTFAVITPALISGSFAERMRFPAFALFTLLWSLFIYAPLAHWVWGGGWIGTKLGCLDFAGGTVVHISSGISALVCALVLGKRAGHKAEPMLPHNLPFTLIGAGLLWVGWFGFNAGSALSSGELASIAMVNTNSAAAAAALAWMAAEFLRHGRATILGAASGAVAGLVVITPAAGFVTPSSAIMMGLLGGAVCYWAVGLKARLGYDDALDVVGVHFAGGTLGAILTGVFAASAVNSAIPTLTAGGNAAEPATVFGSISNGVFGARGGDPKLILVQLLGVLATIAFCGLGTFVLLKIVNVITPLRAKVEEEVIGMDLSQHRERGYAIGGGEAMAAAAASISERSASTPPAEPNRFTVALDGIEQTTLLERWRNLCQERSGGEQPGPEFKLVYTNVSTLRGNRFRFTGGDPDQVRRALTRLFSDINPNLTARIEA